MKFTYVKILKISIGIGTIKHFHSQIDSSANKKEAQNNQKQIKKVQSKNGAFLAGQIAWAVYNPSNDSSESDVSKKKI